MKLSEKFDEILPALHKARSQFVKVKKDRQNTHLKTNTQRSTAFLMQSRQH
ncbi:hypothetical protein [Enterobacter phage N5822]|nr:hypothetical protein [Enterobacter phage N5822]QPD96268.1 hypothetical protein [Enterobacter phage N5822]